MKTISNTEFAERMLAMADPAELFEPTATYDPDGDCIEFFFKPDNFYAERIDDLVTVYYSQESNEIVGSLIKGVSVFCQKVLEKIPGFKIEIHDGRVSLGHIFRARLWTSQSDITDMVVMTYRKLIKVAEETHAEATLCAA